MVLNTFEVFYLKVGVWKICETIDWVMEQPMLAGQVKRN